MNQLLRIALFDPDRAEAARLALSLSMHVRVTDYATLGDILAAPLETDADLAIVSWPRANDELALIVERLSRRCIVIVLITDADLAAARLLLASGAAQICHPLAPPRHLAVAIAKTYASAQSYRLRTRMWRPTL